MSMIYRIIVTNGSGERWCISTDNHFSIHVPITMIYNITSTIISTTVDTTRISHFSKVNIVARFIVKNWIFFTIKQIATIFVWIYEFRSRIGYISVGTIARFCHYRTIRREDNSLNRLPICKVMSTSDLIAKSPSKIRTFLVSWTITAITISMTTFLIDGVVVCSPSIDAGMLIGINQSSCLSLS